MQKKANAMGKQISAEEKQKTLFLLLFSDPKQKLPYTHIFTSQNSVKIVTKSSLVETKQTFGSIIFNCICGSENFSTISSPLFPLNTLNLFFFQMHWFFYTGWYRDRSIWISLWCHFCDISILLNSFWGPIEATFLPWILSSGLSGAHKLRDSSMKHWDFCFHHLQFFVGDNIVE